MMTPIWYNRLDTQETNLLFKGCHYCAESMIYTKKGGDFSVPKPNHHSLKYKQQAWPTKKYKDLKQKQKAQIAGWMFASVDGYYSEHGHMPDEDACEILWLSIQTKIIASAIWVPCDEARSIFLSRIPRYEERILRPKNESVPVKQTADPVKQTAVKPKRKKKRKSSEDYSDTFQDDRFFFIAGYTSGGAPYGLTWEEMGLQPYQSLDEY